jgi:hypothetical protein
MSKTKESIINTEKVTDIAQQTGVLLMTAAVTLGMLELPDHPNSKIVLPNQPALAIAGEHTSENNPIRREREETAPHYVSYNVSQRTPGRSSKV